MKIRDAMLCMDCDELSLKATHCPICASGSVVELARWLPPIDLQYNARERAAAVMAELNNLRERLIRIAAPEDPEPLGVGA